MRARVFKTSGHDGLPAQFEEFVDLQALLNFTRRCENQQIVLTIEKHDGVEEILVEDYDGYRE